MKMIKSCCVFLLLCWMVLPLVGQGWDTAFQAVIRDTLSQHLDISTFRAGASSHAYDWEIFGSGVLKFTFSNIMLPDNHINVAASQGFINFKIAPKETVALGTVLENRAGIYFDYNVPVLTNTTSHTLQLDYLPYDTSTISISGQILNRHGQPEPDVLVTMPNVGEYLTGEDGTYYFSNLNHDGQYDILPDKRTFQEPNISVLDVLYNRQVAIGLMTELLSDFYVWWAAVPHGGSDLTFAVILTHQKILGKIDSFPNHHSWRFVPSAYDFNAVSMPFSTPFPEQISIAQPLTDVEAQDFVGIHLGDIWTSPLPPMGSPEPVFELIPSQDTITSSDFYVDLKVSDFEHIAGLQFTIEWDASLLVLNEFENIVFPIEDISHYTNADLYELGKAPFIWYGHIGEALSLEDETVLCRWHFSSLQAQVESTSIAFTATPARPEVVFSDNAKPEDSLVILNTQFIDTNFPIALSTSTSIILDEQNWTIFPNPMTDFLYVQGQLPQVQEGQIRLYNALGQVMVEKDFEAQQVDVRLALPSLSTGLYELEIYTAMKTWRKKLVLR